MELYYYTDEIKSLQKQLKQNKEAFKKTTITFFIVLIIGIILCILIKNYSQTFFIISIIITFLLSFFFFIRLLVKAFKVRNFINVTFTKFIVKLLNEENDYTTELIEEPTSAQDFLKNNKVINSNDNFTQSVYLNINNNNTKIDAYFGSLNTNTGKNQYCLFFGCILVIPNMLESDLLLTSIANFNLHYKKDSSFINDKFKLYSKKNVNMNFNEQYIDTLNKLIEIFECKDVFMYLINNYYILGLKNITPNLKVKEINEQVITECFINYKNITDKIISFCNYVNKK